MTDRTPVGSRAVLGAVVAGLVIGVLLTAATGVVAAILDVPADTLTREPQTVLDAPVETGAFSNLGVIIWTVAAIAPLVAAALLAGRERRLFLAVGLLSAVMLLDDLFLIHDIVLPYVGIPEAVVQAAYLGGMVLVALLGRDVIGPAGLAGVAVVVGCWGVSVVMDTFFNLSAINMDQLVEDGAKFVGIVVWSCLWAVAVHVILRDRIRLAA